MGVDLSSDALFQKYQNFFMMAPLSATSSEGGGAICLVSRGHKGQQRAAALTNILAIARPGVAVAVL